MFRWNTIRHYGNHLTKLLVEECLLALIQTLKDLVLGKEETLALTILEPIPGLPLIQSGLNEDEFSNLAELREFARIDHSCPRSAVFRDVPESF